MRRHNLIYGILMICALSFLLTACVMEKFDEETDSPSTEEGGYLAVSIVLADDNAQGNTRAQFDGSENVTDGGYFFNNGLEAESSISDSQGANWLLCYNASGELLYKLQLTNINASESSNDKTGKSYTGLCEVPGSSAALMEIEHLKVVFNASTELQAAITRGENIAGITLHQTEAGDIGYLFRSGNPTMSSSMIADGSSTVPAVIKGELKTYPTPQQALENPCATLYVERLQSKYTVLFRPRANLAYDQYFDEGSVWNYIRSTEKSEKATNDLIVFSQASSRQVNYITEYKIGESPNVSRGTWKASIVGWDINGTERSEKLFKDLGSTSSSYDSWNFTPSGLSSAVRNLWTVDPNYINTRESYPDQYRKAWDISTTEGVTSVRDYESNSESSVLNYLPFNNLMKREIRRYSAENTYDPALAFGLTNPSTSSQDGLAAIENRAQFRCGNHLLIGAQMMIQGFDDDVIYNPSKVDSKGLVIYGDENSDPVRVKSKFFVNNIYMTEEAYINYYSYQLGLNLDATTECLSDLTKDFIPKEVFKPSETKFYVYDNGWRQADYRDFTIEPIYIVGGDGWCQPMPRMNGNITILHVHQSDGTYRPITKDEYLKFTYGYPFYFAEYFKEGRMYYAYPIDTGIDVSRNDALDFGTQLGDYGAVRNHWYHYRFTGISSVGVPVGDPEQPIIPNNDPSVLGLGFEVVIIPWHVIYEENVKL